LEASDFKSSWELLNIFAYGTYKDYVAKKGTLNLPELNSLQTKKLKYLTIVSLSEKDKCIPYQVLQTELNIGDIRELEDLIIEAIYTGKSQHLLY
jgi:COP9 signalosome complex subunit 7